MRRFIGITFMFLALAGFLVQPAQAKDTYRLLAISGNGGFLEEVNGMLVIHTKGTPYEMGRQYGELVGDRCGTALQGFFDGILGDVGIKLEDVSWALPILVNSYLPYFPENYLEQMNGMAETSSLDSIMYQALPCATDISESAFFDMLNCSGLAVWGSRTDGHMYQHRNLDWAAIPNIEKSAAIEVAKEEGKIPIANIGWNGMLGIISGMNAESICFSEIGSKNTDEPRPIVEGGIPWSLLIRKILQEADDLDDVKQMIDEAPRTRGLNYVFGDGEAMEALAIETCQNHWAAFKDNDREELKARYRGQQYSIPLTEAVFRADTAMDPTVRSTQICSNGPDGDPRTSGAYRHRYKRVADMIQAYDRNGTLITKEEVEHISRTVAMSDSAVHCIVYRNDTRDVWIANPVSDDDGHWEDASTQPYKHFPFDDYCTTIDLKLNRSLYRPENRMILTLEGTNLGSPASLKLYLFLVYDGQPLFYPNFTTTPEPVNFYLGHKENYTRDMISVKLPYEMKRGKLVWYAAIFKDDLSHMIDFSTVEARFWK